MELTLLAVALLATVVALLATVTVLAATVWRLNALIHHLDAVLRLFAPHASDPRRAPPRTTWR